MGDMDGLGLGPNFLPLLSVLHLPKASNLLTTLVLFNLESGC
jgi:hypothetical protein